MYHALAYLLDAVTYASADSSAYALFIASANHE